MSTYAFYPSPFGLLKIGIDEGKVILSTIVPKQDEENQPTALSEKVFAQLQDYFAGRRTAFSLPYKFSGTEFQQQVWAQIAKIPYGHHHLLPPCCRQQRRFDRLCVWTGNEEISAKAGI